MNLQSHDRLPPSLCVYTETDWVRECKGCMFVCVRESVSFQGIWHRWAEISVE